MKKYIVEATETGYQLDEFDTYEEAEDYILDEEKKDKKNDEYTNGFYTIHIQDIETDEDEFEKYMR